MTGHPASLAPPPPLAVLPQEASIATPATDHATIGEDNAAANLQDGPTHFGDSSEDQATALKLTDTQQTVNSDSTEGVKKKYSDFHTQVTDIAFGPNYEKSGPDFKKYGEALVEKNILPAFAISDNSTLPLNLTLNRGQDKAQHMLNHYRDTYFALKV
jgi:hypothetical protein